MQQTPTDQHRRDSILVEHFRRRSEAMMAKVDQIAEEVETIMKPFLEQARKLELEAYILKNKAHEAAHAKHQMQQQYLKEATDLDLKAAEHEYLIALRRGNKST